MYQVIMYITSTIEEPHSPAGLALYLHVYS